MGWTPERFGEIDKGRSGGRDGVIERVGKKYQWIGFFEILGRIADHMAIKPPWGEERPVAYTQAEQLVWRDIDPTVLVRKPATRSTSELVWFSPVEARFPVGIADGYPADMAGVPDPLDLIAVSDPDGVAWLVLISNPNWEQRFPPEVRAQRGPQLDVWMQLHAYLVPEGDGVALATWASGKDWFGQWMPGIAEPHNLLLGAHPDDPEWGGADGSVNWWELEAGEPPPADLLQCAAWYGGTGTSRDASAEEETAGYVPSRRLFDVLSLSPGVDFTWRDASGGVGVCDPSVVLGGPGTLAMRRDLLPRLAEGGWTIFWTVLIGKELRRGDFAPPGDDYRWISASASYILNGDRIEQVGATAVRCQPGPSTTEREVGWVTGKEG
ncbi:MAG TPA: hypothetical protein VM942_04440 [Acidimicrobiales bacterium]|nr:hypothetical protein [Acidimicrobiales bacterium]